MRNPKRTWAYGFMGFMLFFMVAFMMQGKTAFAANAVTLANVDYENENVIINNNDNTKIYFALERDAAKDNWEVIDADANTSKTTEIDFSWMPASTDNVLILKGEEDGTPLRITILKQIKKLDVSISYSDMELFENNPSASIASLLNIMTTAGTAEKPIDYKELEWKKGEDGKWKDIQTLSVGQLAKYQIMGTDLYLRLKAVNDTTNGLKGRRASSETRLRIAKKASPTSVSVDGGKFTATIRYGKEYRVTTGSTPTTWTKVLDSNTRQILLKDIVATAGSKADGISTAFPKMMIETRDYATQRTAASKISKIKLDAQRVFPSNIMKGTYPINPTPEDTKKVYISYNGILNMNITIPMASAALPYEYCIETPGVDFNVQKATWSAITKNSTVKVLASKALDGAILHVRQKMLKTSSSFELASTEATYKIDYPSVPKIAKTQLTFTKGYSNALNFTVNLNEVGKDLYERRIESIKLGSRDIYFTQTPEIKDSDVISINKVNTITVTLLKDSLESISNSTARPLTITYANGTVDRTSVKLTIQNPTLAGILTVTPATGSKSGCTALTCNSAMPASNTLVYTITPTAVTGKYTVDKVTSSTPFATGADILVTANQYITVYEIDTNSCIVRYKSILITDTLIKK